MRWVLDVIPLKDRVFRRRHTAIILRVLAAGAEAGQTLTELLGRLAASYPRPWVRGRLRKAADRVVRGDDWCEALRVEGLMSRSDSAVLRSAERAGNLAWALRQTADGGERRLAYRLQAIAQILQPLIVVAMGMLVLLFALTYFRPLITLIDALSEVSL
jgi:type II secretory pathway component PulF